MKSKLRWASLAILTTLAFAQTGAPHVLSQNELKKVVPISYFFAGQNASVQLRNAAGVRTGGGKLVLSGLVDTSGYSADTANKYQGFLITEVKLTFDSATLEPGAYGFGFSKDGKFIVMNIAGTDVFSIAAKSDDQIKRPVPLQIQSDGASWRLYGGRKYVVMKSE